MGKIGSDLNPPVRTDTLPPTGEGGARDTHPATEVRAPNTLTNNPADLLLHNQGRFEGVDDQILTGQTTANTWPDLGATALGPGVTGVVLGPVTGDAPPLVTLMPTKGVSGPQVNANIRAKILDGEQLYRQIMADKPPQATKQNAALLMWYLQALASSKANVSSGNPEGGPALFKEGALTIEDPDHRLEEYLQSFNTYRRSSSHLDEYQKIPKCETYGLDLRGVEMPNGRRTVMFARLPSTREAPNGPNLGEKSLLFLKMEPHGCRGLSFQGTGEKTGVWQGIKRFFSNIGDFIGHACGWLDSVWQRKGEGAVIGQNNRERIDKAVREPYKNLLEAIQSRIASPNHRHPQAAQTLLTTLAELLDDPDRWRKIGGVHFMLDKLNRAQTILDDFPLDDHQSSREYVQQCLTNARNGLWNQGDHHELRFGREVILLQNEMTIGECDEVEGRQRHVPNPS
jgi:hypothetical protein